jgi:xanthine dehydrogenase accessory factor
VKIAGILLAAGGSTRMGPNKLLLELDGETLLRRAARRALGAGLDPVVAVLGHEVDSVRRALEGLGCLLVVNPEPERGLNSSLSVGVAAVPADAEAVVVLLADMPLVDEGMIRAVVERHAASGAPLVLARYGEVTAPPALYARRLLPELQGGEGEGRGREVLRRYRAEASFVDLPPSSLLDLDVPADLGRARLGGRAMSDDRATLAQAAAWADSGLGVALATVVATWGSAPCPTGSQLCANQRGEFAGSVSGGCIEAAVVGEALESIRDGRYRLREYGVSDERAWSLGLACGGTVRVLVEPARPALLSALLGRMAERRAAVVATDLSSGEASLLDPFAPEPGAEPDLAAAVREAALRDRSSLLDRPSGTAFLRPYNPPLQVVIVGAVHVAQALAPMVQLAGYDVTVVDPRPAFAAEGRFPGVPLAAGWPEEVLPRLGLSRRSAVIALSHDPKIDDPALAAALRSEAFYLGALGSRKTQAARRERLAAMGFSDAELSRIHGPVGLELGAVSPAEIAVSILSELVACLRRGDGVTPLPRPAPRPAAGRGGGAG